MDEDDFGELIDALTSKEWKLLQERVKNHFKLSWNIQNRTKMAKDTSDE